MIRSFTQRRKWLGVIMVVASVGTMATPVAAHDWLDRIQWWAYREGSNPGECLWAGAEQNHHTYIQVHSGVYREFVYAPWKNPAPYNSCANSWARPGGAIGVRGEWYKDGQWPPCLVGGWVNNAPNTSGVTWHAPQNWNAWPWCNNGLNRVVWITHDTFHRFQKAIGSTAWIEKAARPATGHCDWGPGSEPIYCFWWAGDPQ